MSSQNRFLDDVIIQEKHLKSKRRQLIDPADALPEDRYESFSDVNTHNFSSPSSVVCIGEMPLESPMMVDISVGEPPTEEFNFMICLYLLIKN